MRGSFVVLLEEVIIVLVKACRRGKEVVEFGVDDFHGFWWERFGELGEGVLEAEDLFVKGWI